MIFIGFLNEVDLILTELTGFIQCISVQRFRPFLSSPFVRRLLSVNISHFNLLLRNHWANCNQTLVEWSLDGPLPKLCPVIPTSNQDGRQAKNRKMGDEILIVHCSFSVSQNELKF
jgi:hypothetical protein